MIVRVWGARAAADKVSSYVRHAAERVFPELRKMSGHKGALVLTREKDAGAVDVKVLTLWDSMEPVRRFTGDSPDVAVVEPEAQRVLLDFDRTAAHYEVRASTLPGLPIRGTEPTEPAFTLRSHRPGDMGWIVHRQAVLYAEEYAWDIQFEALIAEITAQFVKTYDPQRERCWIAERHGAIVGSVFVVKDTDDTAKLRLLYVESSARGLGIGQRLVQECIAFARQAGYKRLTLWTNDILVSARRIYEAAGFRLESEERHHSFGHNLVGQYWTLEL